MKNKLTLLIAIALMGFISCGPQSNSKENWKSLGSLQISKTMPQPGQTLHIVYHVKDTAQLDEDFKGYYYTLVNDKVYAHDLSLHREDSLYKGKLTIPDSAVALAFNFKTGENTFDTHDGQGYTVTLYTQKEGTLPGSRAAIAYFHKRFDSRFNLSVKQDSLLEWMKTDLSAHPALNTNWAGVYAKMLYKKDAAKGKAYIENQLAAYSQNNKRAEKDYENLLYFNKTLNHTTVVDSLKKAAGQAYPKGEIAQKEYLKKYNTADSLAGKKAIFEDYQQHIGTPGPVKDVMLKSLARAAMNKGDMTRYQQYMNQLSKPWQTASSYNGLAWNYAQNDTSAKKLQEAATLAEKAVALVNPKTAVPKASKMMTAVPKSQLRESFQQMAQSYRDTYAYVLTKQGKKKEALAQQKKAIGQGDNPEMNERYIQLLLANDKAKKAEPEAAKFIKEGHSTIALRKAYKKAYIHNHGSDKGLADRLSQLRKQAYDKALASIKGKMFDKEAPTFRLKDAQGHAVDLADLKGKTVVLDFWATWCGPCRASFPGMKTAVEYYKNQSDVVFYFVNTWQREPQEKRVKKVTDFIKSHHYPFHVLFDKNVNNNFPVVSSFGITGIPTKIIIGPDGRWKFTKVGFSGSSSKLVRDLKIMVKLAQKTTLAAS